MRRLLALVLLFLAVPPLLAGLPEARAAGNWLWPVRGELLSVYRNGSDPYAAGQHRGIDIAAPTGTPVDAATTGVVKFAGVAGDSGLTVSVRTADGRFDTSYLHLSSVDVQAGRRVRAGERIGAVGTTGRRSVAAPHLHFGVRDAGRRHAYRDPLDFLRPPANPPYRPAAPRPVPVPVGASPRPAPQLVPRLLPPPALAPRPLAVPRSAPVPTGAPVPRPAPVPRAAPAPRSAPTVRPSPVPEPSRRPVPAPRLKPALDSRPAPAGAPEAAHALHPGTPPRPQATPGVARAGDESLSRAQLGPAARGAAAHGPGDARPERLAQPAGRPSGQDGLDVGWLAACIGLVMAAAFLGRPGQRAKDRRAESAHAPALGRGATGRLRSAGSRAGQSLVSAALGALRRPHLGRE